MLRELHRRDDGYRTFAFDALDDLELAPLVAMIDEAWKVDYRDEPRQVFGEPVLRKLTQGPSWVGVVTLGPGDEPVGFELALRRKLRTSSDDFDVFYATVFTVAASHRRRGLGSQILAGINAQVFGEQGAELIVSTFQDGHAGSPTVTATFDAIDGFGVRKLHSSHIWSRRLDRDPLPESPHTLRYSRLVLRGETLDGLGDVETPTRKTIEEELRASFSAGFGLRGSLAEQYLSESNDDSGLLLFALEDPQRRPALFGYNSLPLAINEKVLRPVVQPQFLHAPGWSEAEIEALLLTALGDFARRGHFAASFLDLEMFPLPVLERLGFRATEDRMAFAARGPVESLERLDGLEPPFFFDFT